MCCSPPSPIPRAWSGQASGRRSPASDPSRTRTTGRATGGSRSFTSLDGETSMFAFLKRRGFLLFVGFLLVAALIWLAGPYFAFADYRPLEGETARWIAIAVVALLWFASFVLKRLRAFRASDKLVAAV